MGLVYLLHDIAWDLVLSLYIPISQCFSTQTSQSLLPILALSASFVQSVWIGQETTRDWRRSFASGVKLSAVAVSSTGQGL